MAIHGITPGSMLPVLPGGSRTTGTHAPGTGTGRGLDGAASVPSQPTSPSARAASALPVEAPAGTDPMLWSVLTSEERSFFARARALGQITYGPASRHEASPLPRGGRIDVRV